MLRLFAAALILHGVARGIDSDAVSENKKYCFTMKDEFQIIPGESFGLLPNHRRKEYLAANCFKHFCEPHPRGGIGVFKCVPLPGVDISSKQRRLRAVDSDQEYCIKMKDQYDIEPGKSFGTLPKHQWRDYMSRRCDRFFCRPHPRSGKGTFDCIPLEGDMPAYHRVLGDAEDKDYCFRMKAKYAVIPGQSLGTMPRSMHGEYLAARCYRHFCEPNPLGGRGVFQCTPLEGVVIKTY